MSELRPIVGFEDAYAVDSSGRVFSIDRVVPVNGSQQSHRNVKGKELERSVHRDGYIMVSLSRGGRTAKHRVHRLVMLAFEPIDGCGELDVNHKDGNKSNNNRSNLEWCTRSENHVHRYRVLGQGHSMDGKFGDLHHRAIGVVAVDPSTKEAVHTFGSMMDAHRAGFQASKVCLCVNGKKDLYKGLIWKKLQASSPA